MDMPLRGNSRLLLGKQRKNKKLDKDTTVFYQLGVNWMYSKSHSKALNDLGRLGFKKVYFLFVAPVEDARVKRLKYSNKRINNFNKEMLSKWDGEYIDSTKAILKDFHTVDGLHYGAKTSIAWFNHIFKVVDEDIAKEKQSKQKAEEIENKSDDEDFLDDWEEEPIILE